MDEGITMKAIEVKYHGPTNTRGSRWTAKAEGMKSVTLPYDYAISDEENAKQTAEQFLENTGWGRSGIRITGSGSLSLGRYVFTLDY